MTGMMAEIAAFDGRTAKIVGPARSGKTEALLRRAALPVCSRPSSTTSSWRT